jgi:hypothetical protein
LVTREEWLSILEAYSDQIWPAQIIFFLTAILLTGWVFLKPGRIQNWLIKLYLSMAFAWNGIMWFLILARDMAGDSYGNYFFGSIFIVVSLLFAVDLFRYKMVFTLPTDGWRKVATLSLLLLVFCYPLLGATFGHPPNRLIFPGTFPCPTTALGLLLLTTALPQVDKLIFILLLFCAIPFTPFFQILRYGVYEDTILFISGIYSLILLLRFWKVEEQSSPG